LKKIINNTLLLGIVIVIIVIAWLMGSNSGLIWLLRQVQSQAKVDISYARLEGSLWSDISFEQLSVKWNNDEIKIDSGVVKANIFPLLTGKVDINKLNVENVLYITVKSDASEPQQNETQPTCAIPEIKLPLRVAIEEMSIKKMDLQQDKITQNLFSQLALNKATLGAAIKFEEFGLQREKLKLSSHGNIPLNKKDSMELQLDAQYDLNDRVKNLPISVNLSGVFPHIKIHGSAANPLNLDTDSDIDLSDINAIQWKTNITVTSFEVNKFVNGNTSEIKNAKIEIQGSLKQLQLSSVKVDSTLDLRNLTETLKDEYNTSLHAQLKDRKWTITSLNILQKEKHAQLAINGDIDSDFAFDSGTKANFQIKASQFNWPETDPILSVNSGDMSLSGNIKNYQFTYTGDLTAAKHAITNMRFSGDGDLQKLQIKTFNANYLKGDWEGTGEFSWKYELYWKAELHANNADISILPYSGMESIHSDLDGILIHEGGFKDKELFIKVSSPGLDGKINESKLSTALDFLYQNDSLYFKNIKIKNRGTKLLGDMAFTALSGNTLIESIWTLNAKDISGLYPGLHGQITSQGEIRGSLDSPIASLNLQASNIGNENFNIASISSSLHHGDNQDDASKLEITMNKITAMEQTLSSFSVNGSGDLQHHQLTGNLVIDKENQASLNVDGAWKDKKWYAIVTQTRIDKVGKPSWLQPDGASITLSSSDSSLKNFCLTKVNAVDRICIDNASYAADKSEIQGKIANINLGQLLPRLNSNIHNIEGNLSGDIDLSLDAKFNPSLLTNLYVNNAKIDLASYNPKLPQLNFERIIAKGKTQSGAFVGNAHAAIPGQGDLKADWKFSDLHSLMKGDLSSPVEANLDLSLYKLSLIPEFIPEAQTTSGNWENHIKVSGPLEKPKITGISKLNLDQLSIPRLGIKPKPTTVSLITDNTGTINFTASTRSGDGEIKVNGSVPTYEDIFEGLDLTAQGSKFQLFDLPEAKVVISPTLKVTSAKGVLDLQGKVKVPYARIKVYDTGAGVTLSGDIKIVGQEQQAQTIPLELTADITVELGDDIRVDTAGLKGKLTGSLTISERIGKATTAVGELDIQDGTYAVYGSLLSIKEGKIIFTSSPLENPALQIKAVSKNVTDVVVGVKITGSARNPVVTLFSEPPMDQSDILAYIVLGYPIGQASNEQGELLARAATSIGFLGAEKIIHNLSEQYGLDEVKIQSTSATKETSLVLGKYLSPKLYVQYAVGIGDTVNSMMLDYKWNKRISIKSESGQNQSTDIIYSIEKD